MSTQESKSTFWTDFISGLAGPSRGGSWATGVAAGRLQGILDEAKADVVAGVEAAYSGAPAERRADCAGNGTAVVRMIRSAFDAMAFLADGDEPDMFRELYEAVRALAGTHAEGSVPFRELGRHLGLPFNGRPGSSA